MFLVIAGLAVDAARREECLTSQRELGRRKGAAPGWCSFVLGHDIDDPNGLLTIEEWESREALDRFNATPEAAEARRALPALLTGAPDITIREVARTTAG